MNSIRALSIIFILALVVVFSCKDDKKDACEDTKTAPKTLILKANVFIKNQAGDPIVNEFVTLRLERNGCGANEATYVNNFNGNTDTVGIFSSDYVSMIFDNTADEGFIAATAPDLNAIKNWSNSTILFDDFADGDTLVRDLTINDDK